MKVTIDGVGYGGFDVDGLRIDDRGDCDIRFEAVDSTFINMGAEGVELDEGNDGDVTDRLRSVTVSENGDDGMQIEEEREGNLEVTVNGSVSLDNKPGKAGLEVEESDEGPPFRGPFIGEISREVSWVSTSKDISGAGSYLVQRS